MDFEQIERRNKLEAARFKHDLHMRLIESEHRCMRHIMSKFSARHGLDTADNGQQTTTKGNCHDDHN